MKRNYSLTASALLILLSASVLYGAAGSKAASAAAGAQATLQEIDHQSDKVAEIAFRLELSAKGDRDTDAHVGGLIALQTGLNRIGHELQTLEAERDSLSAWEAKALDQITPLLAGAAQSADKAIAAFNEDRHALILHFYTDETGKIYSDAHLAAALLRDELKLARKHGKEQNLEKTAGEPSRF